MRSRRAAGCGIVCLGLALIWVVIAAGSDRLAPRVSITQPEDAATLQGTTDLTVTYISASDQPIVRVDIWIDDGRVYPYKLKEPRQKGKVEFDLNTQELTNGEHRLQAQVFDAAGHAGQARITVHVQNQTQPTPVPKVAPSGPDLIPPAVTVRQPQNGARVSGRMQVSVEAT
ncbi:MAG: Ig-like domain-containing protein, partial [Armatimonadota bacterium]